ncbi:MAG: hypothetical protein ACFFBD_23940 [Candidatus Hodarchaeota archaeon]
MSSNSIAQQLNKVLFKVLDTPTLPDIPRDFLPDLITQEGQLFILLTNNQSLTDSLFEAVGRIKMLRQYLVDGSLTHKYDVTMVLTGDQFRQLQKELRQILPPYVPLLILV